MSSTLTLEPSARSKTTLNYQLKSVLRKKFAGTISERTMDESDLSYLHGLLDAGIEDAKIVIEFIEKYGEVVLNEEF